MNDETAPQKQPAPSGESQKEGSIPSARKDSTNEVPMFDLEEVLKLVTKIHNEGLETAAMPDVAKACGYAHPSSTPFYRRMLAARLFGLLSKSGAELSVRATNYLKPDSEDAHRLALNDAILGIPLYAETIQKFAGKKLNVQLVANGFEKQLGITSACALTCAKVFESSLRQANFLNSEGLVSSSSANGASSNAAKPQAEQQAPEVRILETSGPTKTYHLPLKDNRQISITAPLDLTQQEITRLQKWVEVTLFLSWDESENG